MVISMTDLIVVIILVLVFGASITYMIREKKKGVKCIGCPAAGQCARKSAGTSGCSCQSHSDAE